MYQRTAYTVVNNINWIWIAVQLVSSQSLKMMKIISIGWPTDVIRNHSNKKESQKCHLRNHYWYEQRVEVATGVIRNHWKENSMSQTEEKQKKMSHYFFLYHLSLAHRVFFPMIPYHTSCRLDSLLKISLRQTKVIGNQWNKKEAPTETN